MSGHIYLFYVRVNDLISHITLGQSLITFYVFLNQVWNKVLPRLLYLSIGRDSRAYIRLGGLELIIDVTGSGYE